MRDMKTHVSHVGTYNGSCHIKTESQITAEDSLDVSNFNGNETEGHMSAARKSDNPNVPQQYKIQAGNTK